MFRILVAEDDDSARFLMCEVLREGNCDLPVLMVTARVTQDDKRRGFRAGTDDYTRSWGIR